MAGSIPYYNRSAPFWDFVADLERQGQSHPLFAGHPGGPGAGGPPFPWGWARQFGHPFGGNFAAEGEQAEASASAPDPPTSAPADTQEKAVPVEGETEDEPMTDKDQSGNEKKKGKCGGRNGRGGRGRGACGGRARGGFGPWGPRGFRWGPGGPGGPFNLNSLAQFFNEQMTGGQDGGAEAGDFKPAIDVFDTETSYLVHISLPGVKKEDVAVSWDAERSEISLTGVVHRPGDEELLKTLALAERQVGAFERKVRLGSRANPAQVDVEGITAKLEDGILRIEVPKEDKDYVEVKKVDIE